MCRHRARPPRSTAASNPSTPQVSNGSESDALTFLKNQHRVCLAILQTPNRLVLLGLYLYVIVLRLGGISADALTLDGVIHMTGKPPLSARTRTLGALKLLGGATLVGLPLHLLGLPAGMLLGSIFGAALVNQPWTSELQSSDFPRPLRHLGMIIIGLISGVLLTVDSLAGTAAVALPITLAYLGLGALSLLFISFLMARYGADPATAVLAVTPGGLGEITSIAIDKGAHLGLVITIHSVRLFTIVLLILPVLLWGFSS